MWSKSVFFGSIDETRQLVLASGEVLAGNVPKREGLVDW